MTRSHAIETRRVLKFHDGVTSVAMDSLIQEEPLVINVGWPGVAPSHFTTTMRTPGDDFALAVGLLVTEAGVSLQDIAQTRYCVETGTTQDYNKVTVDLVRPIVLGSANLRPVSCGWCGVADLLDRLDLHTATTAQARYRVQDIEDLFEEFDRRQHAFQTTGASHAALIRTIDSAYTLGEDVGRHNALDKAIGHATIDGVALSGGIALLSGRAGSDLILKAANVGITHVASVSAPTALAVEIAQKANITLIGFARAGRFNLYSHAEGLVETYDATRVLR